MNKWIVVADASRARLFAAGAPSAPLTEVQDFVHLASRHSADSVVDTRVRSANASKQARHDTEPRTAPKQHEMEQFARELGQFLDKACAEHRFEALTLVAAPDFLGVLRGAINPRTTRCVTATLDKDFTRLSADEIAARLRAH